MVILSREQCETIRERGIGVGELAALLDTVEELRERLEDVADHIEQGASSQIIRAHIAKALE